MTLIERTNTSILLRQAWRFVLVGTVGFFVDGSLLVIGHNQLGLDWSVARLLSFTVAVTLTWLLNRRLTFAQRTELMSLREWRSYLAINGIGALLNLGIFLGLVGLVPPFRDHPLVALMIAAAIALIFNFIGSRNLVFSPPAVEKSRTSHG